MDVFLLRKKHRWWGFEKEQIFERTYNDRMKVFFQLQKENSFQRHSIDETYLFLQEAILASIKGGSELIRLWNQLAKQKEMRNFI
jgi:hypothetical protein